MTGRRHRILDHRQRAFARFIAEGKAKADAQILAGYKPNRKNANQLLNDERVIAEIGRLRALADAEWARLQCNDRLLLDPRFRAAVTGEACQMVELWLANQERTRTKGESE